MSDRDREVRFGDAIRSISGSFSADFSVIDLLHHVVDECRSVLGVADVGVVLADRSGRLHVAASTSERTSLVESLQIDTLSGPCMESYRTGQAVLIRDIADRSDEFAKGAREQDFRSAYATPLRRHIYTIGALNLFSAAPDAFPEESRSIADAFARIAAMAILVDRRGDTSGDRVEEALRARVDIERAKGVVMDRANVDEARAFEKIHDYSVHNLRPLISVARDITRHQLQLW